jgi:hypothetical protein
MKLFAGREKDQNELLELAKLDTFTKDIADRAKEIAGKHLGGQFAVEDLES